MVEAVAVVVKTSFGIVVFRGEAMAEEAGERARLGDDVAEGVVGVLGDGVSADIEVAYDVAIHVLSWRNSIGRRVGDNAPYQFHVRGGD